MKFPQEDEAHSTPGKSPNGDIARPHLSRLPGNGARVDWETAIRSIDRKRRALTRSAPPPTPHALPANQRPAFSPNYFARATAASFHLDGLPTVEEDVRSALARVSAGKAQFRSRQAQRIRNHVAVLLHVESLLRRGEPLESHDIIRFYASISCGLSTAQIDGHMLTRLEGLVARVNSPQLRLRPAVEDIVQLHQKLLADPFVPAFNGILARIILHYHLGRCGLPPVIFTPPPDAPRPLDLPTLTRRLLELLDEAYDGKRSNGQK